MRNLSIPFTLLVLCAVFLIAACSAPSLRPAAEVVSMPTEELAQGRELFHNRCATCHPGGMAAVGPAIINKPLPKFLIRYQIRHGLGTMPAFDDILSDEQVEHIAEYLSYLKKGGRGKNNI